MSNPDCAMAHLLAVPVPLQSLIDHALQVQHFRLRVLVARQLNLTVLRTFLVRRGLISLCVMLLMSKRGQLPAPSLEAYPALRHYHPLVPVWICRLVTDAVIVWLSRRLLVLQRQHHQHKSRHRRGRVAGKMLLCCRC